MGIVARQSIKYSFVGYFSVLIGVFTTLFIYPYNLEFAGKLQFVLATALLILPVVSLGIAHANIRFYPRLSKTNDHQHLLRFSMFFLVVNGVFVSILYVIAALIFPSIQQTDMWEMAFYIFPLLCLLSIIQLLSRYISIKKRIVVPNIFENIFPKLGMIAAFTAYHIGHFSELVSILIFLFFYLLSLIGMYIYVQKIDPFQNRFSSFFLHQNHFKSELLQFSLYTFLGSIGSVIALNIDTYMIGEFLGYAEVSVYNTTFNLIRMITVPALGIYTISAPIIAQYIEEANWLELKALHHKTSLYLFTLGALLFSCIAIGIDDLFLLMKNGEALSKGKNVVYIIGFALLFDLATGFNGYIITNSKYYKFNNTLTVALAFLTILSNLFFLFYLKLGIIGVAWATCISMNLYNLIKIAFNYKKFGVHPFSFRYGYVIGFVILSVAIGFILPNSSYKTVNLFYKPLIPITIFIVGNQLFKIIPIPQWLSKKMKI